MMKNQGLPIFSINMRYLRNQQGLTQLEAAKMAGIKRGTYQAYEDGRAMPRMENLPAICRVLEFNDVLAMITKDLTHRQKKGVENREPVSIESTLIEVIQISRNALKKINHAG